MSNRTKKRDEVYNWIKEYIQQNTFSTNLKLPSENAICTQLHISRTTVREALQLLAQENLIYTLRGSGTYINTATTTSMTGDSKAAMKIGAILQGQDKNANVSFEEGMRSVLKSSAVDLQIYFTDNNFANERFCLESVSNQGFDGFIVDGVKSAIPNPNLDYYQRLLAQKTPAVFYNNYYTNLSYPRITIDNQACAEALVSPLLQAGHKRIAGIFWCDNQQSLEKFNGFAKSMHLHGGELRDEDLYWMLSHDASGDEFEKKLIKFLKNNHQCRALVCCNYMVYCSVKQALARMGNPKYDVACFDYSAPDWQAESVLCTIHPGFSLGASCAQALLRMIAHGDYDGMAYNAVLEPQIYNGTTTFQL